jgi:hypothetical protein
MSFDFGPPESEVIFIYLHVIIGRQKYLEMSGACLFGMTVTVCFPSESVSIHHAWIRTC